MIIKLTLGHRISFNVTIRTLIVNGKAETLLERLKQNTAFELIDEVITFLNRDFFYKQKGSKIIKVNNINKRDICKKLIEFNDFRKDFHQKMSEYEDTKLYSNSENIAPNNYNNRWARETICATLMFGV